MNNFYKILRIKKIDLDNNYLIIFRNLKINLSKGEIYLSYYKNRKQKNWKCNSKITQNFFVVKGKFKFEIFNKKKEKKKIIQISHSDQKLLKVYQNIWYRITPMSSNSIILNQISKKKHIFSKYEKKYSKNLNF
jgi:hypothetical protein